MTPELAKLIQRAYPDGTVYGIDEDALEDEKRDGRIHSVLASVASRCRLRWWTEPCDKPAYSICLTQTDHPAFDSWLWAMDNASKTKWIRQNAGPYPVLWIKISRVADFYYLHFNHWTPRGDTGYLDASCRIEPNERWKQHQETLEEALKAHGFMPFPDTLSHENTSLVKKRDYDSIPNDDPRWDDADFEPPLVDASLHDCLFSY